MMVRTFSFPFGYVCHKGLENVDKKPLAHFITMSTIKNLSKTGLESGIRTRLIDIGNFNFNQNGFSS